MANWDDKTKFFFKVFLGTPLKLWASVGHWALWHFDLSKYTPKQHPRVRRAGGKSKVGQGHEQRVQS